MEEIATFMICTHTDLGGPVKTAQNLHVTLQAGMALYKILFR
jgi:hypothetical protein